MTTLAIGVLQLWSHDVSELLEHLGEGGDGRPCVKAGLEGFDPGSALRSILGM